MGFKRRHHLGHYTHEHKEFHRSYKYLRVARPVALLFNLLTLYLLFRWLGNNTVTILFAVFVTLKEVAHLYLLWRLERRIFRPLELLRNAVETVAQGNYDVYVETRIPNEIGVLIKSFNEMARELRESEKTKQRYEENRKALLMNISHDLKTPLSSIRGHIEMIREGKVASPEKVDLYLQIIDSNIKYMTCLVDDLFLFSKLDMDKLEFNFELVNFQDYMRDVADELRLELEEKAVRLAYSESLDKAALVRIDRKRIHQVIRNIVDNALKYGQRPDLQIALSLAVQQSSVLLIISDNGPGISADVAPHIFDRFYRQEKQRPKDLNSTGLGLAIAKELVEAHGGVISVHSQEGQGTSFMIQLPLSEEGATI